MHQANYQDSSCQYSNRTRKHYSDAWSPDSKYIVSAGADRVVHVWNAITGKAISVYHGHVGLSNVVATVAWSPDGKRIASGGTDKTVQLWDAASGENIFVYRQHTGIVYVAKWLPDGQRIASGSADTTVRIWQAT